MAGRTRVLVYELELGWLDPATLQHIRSQVPIGHGFSLGCAASIDAELARQHAR